MSDRFVLRIPLEPSVFQRPRPNKHGGFYSPHSAAKADWQRLIQNQMRLANAHILEGPVSVSLHIGANETCIEVAQVVGANPGRPKGVKGDLDNHVKLVLDALSKLAFFDDVQVVDLHARFVNEE